MRRLLLGTAPFLCLLHTLGADLPSDSVINDHSLSKQRQENLLRIIEQALNSKQIQAVQPYLAKDFKIGKFSGVTASNILNEVVSHYPRVIESFTITSINDEGKGMTRINSIFKSSDGDLIYNFLVTPDGCFKELNILKEELFKPSLVRSPAQFEIPIELKQNLILTQGAVNGRKGLFLVDSGSDTMSLNSLCFSAESASRPTTLSLDVSSVKVASGQLHVETFSLGPLEIKGFDVPLEDLSGIEKALDSKIIGIIGFDQLSLFELKFDIKNRNLGFLALKANGEPLTTAEPLRRDEISFEMGGHLPVLTCTSGTQVLRCALDSGVGITSIDLNLQNQLSDHVHFIESGNFVTVNGVNKGKDFYALDQLSFNQLDFHGVSITFVDFSSLSDSISDHFDGIISFNLLKDKVFSVNYKRKVIYIYR